MIGPRRGMALALTIGVVSLIAILAVATLSLAGRLEQQSTLALRDARLDAGVELGLASASSEWRERRLGALAVGATVSFAVTTEAVPVSVVVSVTRVSDEIFWVTSEARSEGGGVRRENVILRARVPDSVALVAEDTTNVQSLGFILVDSLAVSAAVQLPGGSTATASDGVVHVLGDMTLAGGAGRGTLIVDGRLTITGPLLYEGVIVARGGITVVVSGVTIRGIIRAAGDPPMAGVIEGIRSGKVAQDVLRQSLAPMPVVGRRWSEMP